MSLPKMGVGSLTTTKTFELIFLITEVKYIQDPELAKYGKAQRKIKAQTNP